MGRFWLNKTSAETGKLRAGKAELIFFLDKINLKKVSESFISIYDIYEKFRCEEHFLFHIPSLQIASI